MTVQKRRVLLSPRASQVAWVSDGAVFVAGIKDGNLVEQRKVAAINDASRVIAVGEKGAVAVDTPGESLVVYLPNGRTIKPPVPTDDFGTYERYGVAATFVPPLTELPGIVYTFPAGEELLVYSLVYDVLDAFPPFVVFEKSLYWNDSCIEVGGVVGIYGSDNKYTIIVVRNRRVYAFLSVLMPEIYRLPFRAAKVRVWKGWAVFLCDTGDVYALSLASSKQFVRLVEREHQVVDMEISPRGEVVCACAGALTPRIVCCELAENEAEYAVFLDVLEQLPRRVI